jgi:tetratricopeptide (TPR) repeat protein
VWKALTQICIKTSHLDAASVCFQNLGNPLALCAPSDDALLEFDSQPETRQDQLAEMAIQLGLHSRIQFMPGAYALAEDLYTNSGNNRKLAELRLARGQWNQVLQSSVEDSSQMQLQTVYYNYGKHLESEGNTEKAVEAYEKANAAK